MTSQPPEPEQEQSNPSLETTPDQGSKTESNRFKGISKKSTIALIQFTPLGSATPLFISAYQKQEWVLMVQLLPLIILALLWANYAGSFLERLGEILEAKGREDVDNLIIWLKPIDWLKRINKALGETIRWQLAGTEDKYLKCQGNECVQYKTEGFENTFTPLLSEVFVSLELSGDFLRDSDNKLLPLWPGFSHKLQKIQASGCGLSVWYILQEAKRNTMMRSLIIQAWGGYGKTTLLRHLTYIYTRKLEKKRAYNAPKLLPVLLYLRKWQELIGQADAPDLPTLIEQEHIPSLAVDKGLQLPPNWARNHLRKGKMLIMLDGFDEVKEEWRDSVSQWIGKQLQDYPETFFILTSRPAGYRRYSSENKPNTSLFIKPFNQQQQEGFIQSWYLSRERFRNSQPNHPVVEIEANRQAASLNQQLQPIEGERNPLRDLARNPLLLNTIVNLHASYPDEQLPQRRADLYKAIVRLQLGDRPLARQIDMPLEVHESQQVLQRLALFMTQANLTQIEPEQLERKLQSYLTAIDESVSAQIFLNKIEQVSELLVKVDDAYEFAHKSFQEYLAACEIKRTQQEDLLLENWSEQWYSAIIILYVAQLKNPNLFLRRLADIPDSEATKLAYKCLQETSRKVDEDLAQELAKIANKVQDRRYQQLEQYLKQGQWQEADRETYRLMLETVGKEERQWLEPEDLENFPCEDLRKLDQLWVDYSQGKFGFSVQKKIYFELGGTKELNWEEWEKFGSRVGWYNKEKGWCDDSRIELLDTTPYGHIPYCYCFGGGRGWGVGSILYSRAQTCRL